MKNNQVLLHCIKYNNVFDAINYLVDNIDGATFANTDKYFNDFKCRIWHTLDGVHRYMMLGGFIAYLQDREEAGGVS